MVEGSFTIDTTMPRTPKTDDLYPAVTPSEHFNPHLAGVEYGTLDGLVGYAVRHAQLHIYEDFVRSLQTWNITPPRSPVMTVIMHSPNLKLTELANILGATHSSTVLLVDTLEDMGMVEHQLSPKDKRAFRLVLTAKGATTLDEITCAVTAHNTRVTACFSADERQTLLALLNKLASGLDSAS